MKLIVGLGNVGDKYIYTRHNVGFLFLNFLVKKFGGDVDNFRHERKFESDVLKLDEVKTVLGDDVLFVKPQTYMNESGRAVIKLIDYYKLNPVSDLMLVHDDLDLAFGKYKIQPKGPRVHNGVNSVVQAVNALDFWRIRIGIAGEHYSAIKMRGGTMKDDYVLKNFSKNELEMLGNVFEGLWDRMALMVW